MGNTKLNKHETRSNVLLCILLLVNIYNSFGLEKLKEKKMIEDFSIVKIDDTTELNLDSNWAFYWQHLITPGNFNENQSFKRVTLNNWTHFSINKNTKLPSFGYATYRKHIVISKDRPHVSLFIPASYASSKLWINGILISEIGKVGSSKETTQHRRFSQIIPLNTNETNFEIVIQVSNFYHKNGGIAAPLVLASTYHLYNLKSKKIIADMVFIGAIGFIGVFFLFFFLFYWNKDQAVLYFAILCISLSYMSLSDRYAPFTELLPNVSWIVLTKIEYVALFLSGAGASLFFRHIFTNFIHFAYSKVVLTIFSILSLLGVLLPAPYFTYLLLPFLISMLLNFIYITFVVIKAILKKRNESILLLISMLLGTIIFFVHIFFFIDKNGYAIIFVNFGYVFVFLLLSMLLMTRFSDSFVALEKSEELAIQQRQEISLKSNELSTVNLELEENLNLLERSNTELDDFNHIVSHDLKSPLVSVHALASFIEEDLKDSIDVATKNHLKLLKNVVSKMDALINGLLEYSKIARGSKNKESFSFNGLLKTVCEIIDNQNNSTIHYPKKDLIIYANKIELAHVFQNLISNAIKHNDKDRAIININVHQQATEYVFSIQDNGPGIALKYHDKIFKMFSQLNLNEDIESTGIGLAIVKKIISENKGIITLESQEKMGLTITFTWRI